MFETYPFFILAVVVASSIMFLFFCIYITGNMVVLVGTRSKRLFSQEEAYFKNGHLVLSADQIRDEQFEETGSWKNENLILLLRIINNIFNSNEVVVSTSDNSRKTLVFLSLMAKTFEVIDLRLTREAAIAEWIAKPDVEVISQAPIYFQRHSSPDFSRYPEGAARARAVMLYELQRYQNSRFLPEPLAYK